MKRHILNFGIPVIKEFEDLSRQSRNETGLEHTISKMGYDRFLRKYEFHYQNITKMETDAAFESLKR